MPAEQGIVDGMRMWATGLGIVGGIVGVCVGGYGLFVVVVMGEADKGWLAPISLLIAAGIAGLVGAALVGSRPQPSGMVLGTAGLVLLVVLTILFARRDAPWLVLISGLCGAVLIAAAAFAFRGRAGRPGT